MLTMASTVSASVTAPFQPSCMPASPDGLPRFQDNFSGFEKRFEVGENARPAAGNGLDELGIRAIHHMGDGQLHGVGDRVKIDRAARISFGFQLWPEFVAPLEDEAFGRINLDNLARVG